MTIYTFHMPLFALLSGLVAHKSPATTSRLAAALVPFVGFTLLYEGSEFLATGDAQFLSREPGRPVLVPVVSLEPVSVAMCLADISPP